MTRDATGIETLIGEGDYFEALGVRAGTAATDIAVAAARLAAQHPGQARQINAIAAVLRDPQQRDIYLIARQARDAVLRRELGPQLRAAIPDATSRVWSEIQRLLRCTFELGQVGVGPRGARSLAGRHDWIKEALVNSAFPVLAPSPAERRAQCAYRDLVYRQDCPDCGGDPAAVCGCRDSYRFDIPAGALPGTLLGAPGERTGRFTYMILDRAVLVPRPYRALSAVYSFHTLGGGGKWAEDITLEEAQQRSRAGVVSVLGAFVAVCVLSGWLISSPLIGVVVALPTLAASIAANLGSNAFLRRAWILWLLAVVLQPLVGALLGSVLATTVSGLLTGLVPDALVGVLAATRRRIGV